MGKQCQAHRDNRKGQSDENGIDNDKGEIVGPAQQSGDFPPPARSGQFPDRHGDKDTQKYGHADARLVLEKKVSHLLKILANSILSKYIQSIYRMI